MKIVNPVVGSSSDVGKLASRQATLEGAVVGLLDNGKKGTERIFDNMEKILREQYHVADVLRVKKSDFSRPAPDVVLEQLAAASAVISGVGD